MREQAAQKIFGNERLVSVAEAARLLSVSEVTVRRMLTTKRLPRRKVLRRTVILTSDLAKVVRVTA